MEERIEDVLTKGLDVQEGRAGVVEPFSRIVADEKVKMHCLVDQDRIGGVIAVLANGERENPEISNAQNGGNGEGDDSRDEFGVCR